MEIYKNLSLDNLENEIWRDVVGYEGLYQVSNFGRVKSLKNNKTKKEKILKPIINSSLYLQVDLCKNKTIKRFLVHRLVANAFLPNPTNLPCVNHIDECSTNNVVTNIEWCSYKYNDNFGTRNERIGKANSKSMTNNPKLSKQVGAYKDGELVMVFPSTAEAKRQGFNQGNVAACCRNCFNRPGNNVYKGYEWRYL